MEQNARQTFKASKASINRHFRPPIVQHPLARAMHYTKDALYGMPHLDQRDN